MKVFIIFIIWSITFNKIIESPFKKRLRSTTEDGWKQLSNGQWVYMKNNSRLTGWQELNWKGGKNWFFFDPKGIMLTGWQELSWSGGVNWFYFDKTYGIMLTGWYELNWSGGKCLFYFDPSKGYMYTNKVLTKANGDKYIIDLNGCSYKKQ